MAHYLVRGRPRINLLSELRARLNSGEIAALEPFGVEMESALRRARADQQGRAVWEETCYCPTPLRQEREVLNRYFSGLMTLPLRAPGEGWAQIDDLPSLWTLLPGEGA
jgi:hypothetical protein